MDGAVDCKRPTPQRRPPTPYLTQTDCSGDGAYPQGAPPPLLCLSRERAGTRPPMSENPQQESQPDVPHEDELDVEGPNESAPGHNPPDDEDADAEQ